MARGRIYNKHYFSYYFKCKIQKMMCYSVQAGDMNMRYGFLSFAKNVDKNIGKNISKT